MNNFANFNFQIPELWEVRDAFNKVKNVVLNYTEMEAKVHEATNNEAWGASSTLMQEIAQATFHYEYFNEIMPTIYKRFTEKEARQWRQIYKSLVLLEYLVKNGSERVVDDARSHISMIKMMKNFHYIDDKGKDQGINVRNRAKELAELLNDVEAIKAERKKAKKNRNKYTGVGSDGNGARYEGFGSDAGYSAGGYDNMDSYGSGRSGRYDEETSNSSPALSEETARSAVREEPKQPKATTAKELNLFDFDEPVKEQKSHAKSNDDDWGDFAGGNDNEDEFDDFQSAPAPTFIHTNTVSKTNTVNTPKKSNDIFDLLGEEDTFTSTQPSTKVQDLSFDTLSISNNYNQPSVGTNTANTTIAAGQTSNNGVESSNNNSIALGGIWSQASNLVSLDSLGSGQANQQKTATQGPSMNALKSSNVNAGWNNWATANTATTQKKPDQSSNAFGDLLF